MARIVMKFGGTSVGDVDRIRNVAAHVKREVDAGHQVAVVVSAMSGETNRLVGLTRDVARLHDAREYDVVVSAGEQVSVGLLAMALQDIGVSARSWLGWQISVQTSDVHGAARIEAIEPEAMEAQFSEGRVAVIAGFQGVSGANRITTLGRGGSDTSAVAIAAALKADRCDIYTDVDGVYTTDPRMVPAAKKMDRVSYEEMLEMASLGAKVLQTRSVELAMAHNVRLQVRSSFDAPEARAGDSDIVGTLICDEDEIMETEIVSGIAYARNEAKVTLREVADRPGIAASIFGPLADASVNVDMIVQNMSADGKTTDVTFTVSQDELERALAVLKGATAELTFADLQAAPDMAKISIVGVGMRSHAGVAQKMFQVLAEKGINIHVISTSEIKVSVLIDVDYVELAVRALHAAYGLDDELAS
ncbi:MAG: aspartate kinase [Rhodobiaceae bacterium]|jgi:aspartate kinase|nr:aspartate kinase [Rhodobiaceae bacterium]MBT5518875.1 aspartate kinase [Rhodobiaceae bacterium]MBT7279855.1 aspartate kinase [Rhodobiaceae bacterium]MDG2495245.1 aspartate kinase [Alphaproteobacteria bacterium]